MKNDLWICLGIVAAFSLFSCTTKESAAPAGGGNAVVDAIMARRSVRKYKETPVEKEKLDIITQCGINAANGMNSQPWAVRVVTDEAFIEGATDVFRREKPDMVEQDAAFKTMFRNAYTIICIASPEDGSGNVDAGLMAGNMMLAAQSLGLGTCCMQSPAHFLNTIPAFEPYLEALDIPQGYKLSLVIAVGYPDESPAAKPRDESKIKYIR